MRDIYEGGALVSLKEINEGSKMEEEDRGRVAGGFKRGFEE